MCDCAGSCDLRSLTVFERCCDDLLLDSSLRSNEAAIAERPLYINIGEINAGFGHPLSLEDCLEVLVGLTSGFGGSGAKRTRLSGILQCRCTVNPSCESYISGCRILVHTVRGYLGQGGYLNGE